LLRNKKLLVYLLVVTVVTGVEGVPLYLISDQLLKGAYNLGLPMMLPALFSLRRIYIRYSRRRPIDGDPGRDESEQYVLVGLAQGFAALPASAGPG